MELICKLASNNTPKIEILPSASKYATIKFADQCLNILNIKKISNGLKGIKKMQNGESLFKYQLCIYNVQSKSDVNQRSIKMRWDNKRFNN